MEWYILVIGFLAVWVALSMATILWLIEKLNDLRIENAKLRIDLLHE